MNVKDFFHRHRDTCRLLLQVFLLTLGVYVSFPMQGVIATVPLGFLFLLSGCLVGKRRILSLGIPSALAFFYASALSLADPFLFALYVLVQTAFAFFACKGLETVRCGKRLAGSLMFFLILILSLVLTLFYCGTPAALVGARESARDYLAKSYPDQRFSELELYYHAREKGYKAIVSYEFGGNLLESELFFGEDVEDGFKDDLTLWMQEKRKSELIEALSEMNVVTASEGMIETDVVRGAYGKAETLPADRFLFSATFREEKPQRRDFAESVSRCLLLLEQAEFDFGEITFYGLDAGNVVYACTVTPDTPSDPEGVLTLVTGAKK